jgi:hypothetical protein
MAFNYRGDLIAPMPAEMEAALVARATEGAFTPNLKEAMFILERLRISSADVTAFRYRSPAGDTAVLALRGEDKQGGDGGKSMRQFHCILDRDGNAELVAGLPSAPRLLFGFDLLSARPEAPVMVVEGEKTAEKGAERFPHHLLITSVNGAQSPHKTDWSDLAGRDVTIWPDNDKPGVDYARSVAAHALASGANAVRIVRVPDGLAEGWDLADDLPPEVSEEDLQSAVTNAAPAAWDEVKSALRSDSDEHRLPPFRLPDGHLAKHAHVVAAVNDALEHISSGCHRREWWWVLGGIYHALGPDGLSLAVEWSRRGADEHGKFHEGEVEKIFETFAVRPLPHPMPLRSLFWRAWRESAAQDAEGNGWRPEPEAMAEAELALFESEHRKFRLDSNITIAIQEKTSGGSYRISQISEEAARSFYKPRLILDFEGKKKVSVFELWERNQRIPPLKAVFRPGEDVAAGEFNLFQGLALSPSKGKGSYGLFRQLIDRISAENEVQGDYIWKLLAYRIQNLHTFVPIVLILLGPQGSFKSTFTSVIAHLLAPYSISISDPENLAGRNNGVLHEKLFVQAEEVELKSDEHNNKFKNYVLNDIIDFHDKYKTQWQGQNRGFIAITTNSRLPVKVPPDSRRYAVLGVSDPFDGDEAKRGELYGRMQAELESGGYEALLYDLQHANLDDFNPRVFPKTPKFRELVEMEVGKEPITAWLREVLENRGVIWNQKVWGWNGDVSKDDLYSHYSAWSDHNGITARNATLRKDQWAKRLMELLSGNVKSVRRTAEGKRAWFLSFAHYETCCRAYEEQLKCKIERAASPPTAPGAITPLPAIPDGQGVAEEGGSYPF